MLGTRIAFIGLVISVVQILLFGILYSVVIFVYQALGHMPVRGDLNWGITLHYGFIFYSIVAVIINGIVAKTKLQGWSIVVSLFVLGVFDYYWVEVFVYRPYKVSFLLALSNGLFVLTYWADNYWDRKNLKVYKDSRQHSLLQSPGRSTQG